MLSGQWSGGSIITPSSMFSRTSVVGWGRDRGREGGEEEEQGGRGRRRMEGEGGVREKGE